MDIVTIEEACLKRKQSGHEAAVSCFSNKVVALYKDKKERGMPNVKQQEFSSAGSGVLLSLSSRKFLVTAGHVLRSAKNSPMWLLNNELFESFGGTWRVTGKNGVVGEGPIDFGWIEIDEELSKKISESRFVTEDQMTWSMSGSKDRGYTVIGYPHSKNKKFFKDVHVGTWTYTSEGTTSKDKGLDEFKDHLFVSYNPKKLTDDDGRTISNAIYPQGASGGAFIDLGNFKDPDTLVEERAPMPKLAGIFIEYHKVKEVLIGMKIKNIIDDIKRECAL